MSRVPYMKLNPHLPEIIDELRDERYRPHPRDIRTAVDELESMARRIDALEELTERLTAERDEARRIAAYQYAKHSNYGDESFAMKNFFQFHKWEYLKEDGK